jgi:hypothetical protein
LFFVPFEELENLAALVSVDCMHCITMCYQLMLELEKMRLTGHVAHMGEGKYYIQTLVGKPERNRQLRIARPMWDRLCGLVVRVPGYRFRGPSSILGTTRFSEK